MVKYFIKGMISQSSFKYIALIDMVGLVPPNESDQLWSHHALRSTAHQKAPFRSLTAVGTKLLLCLSVLTGGASNLRPDGSLLMYCERKCEVSPDTLRAFLTALFSYVKERVGSVSPTTFWLCLKTLFSLAEFCTLRLLNQARKENVKRLSIKEK